MKNRILFLLAFLCVAQMSFAAVTVKGRIFDKSTGQPMEYATVTVASLPDSAFVTGTITQPDGTFELSLDAGRYVFTLQYMGYRNTVRNVTIDGSKNLVELGRIYLLPDEHLLAEVNVVAEVSTYEMTLDKRVFNVGKDVATTAGNAIEVLENIPAVSVDVEGNVSLRGDEGVRILIDGKESGLSGMSTQDALRTIQADMIERVEVVTNPSVRYDAEGTAGIINIVLKKGKRQGFNGVVNLRAAYPWQYGVGLSLNYRMKRFNCFVSYNYDNRSNIGGGVRKTKRYSDINGPDTTFVQLTDQITERSMQRNSHNIRFGTDYFIGDNEVLSLALVYRAANNRSHPVVAYSDEYPLIDSSSYDVREEWWQGSDPVYEVTLDYEKRFEQKDRSLKANLRFFDNAELSHSDISDFLYPSSETRRYTSAMYQRTNEDQSQRNLQASVDYVHPFAKKALWEVGGKYTLRQVNSISTIEDSLGGIWTPLDNYCYYFDYHEQIGALYSSLGNDWGRWSGQVGLRAELTDVKTVLHGYAEDGNDSINGSKPYIDWFPSAHLNYSVSENDQVQVSYTRRIRRPRYRMLSPFRSYNDNRNIRMGNPALKPVYTDSYELGYLHFWDKATFSFTTYYRHSVNTMQHYTYLDSVEQVYYSMPINFGTSNDFGMETMMQGQLAKWWNLNANCNFFRSISEGIINDCTYPTDSYVFFGRLMSKFSLKKWFDLQLTAHYMGPRVGALGKRSGEWWIDFAVSKDVFGDNGTITFNVRDVFGTRGHGGESWGDHFWQYSMQTWTKTTFSLNFSYRFNQQDAKRKRNDMNDNDNGSNGGDDGEEYF